MRGRVTFSACEESWQEATFAKASIPCIYGMVPCRTTRTHKIYRGRVDIRGGRKKD